MQPVAIRNTILCVDDEEATVWLPQSALMANGYTVLPATNGLRALQLLSAHKVDVVILNYYKAGTNSEQVAAAMKRLRPETPIVLFSGERDVPSSALTHVDATVQKVEGPDGLFAVLRRLLHPPARPLPVADKPMPAPDKPMPAPDKPVPASSKPQPASRKEVQAARRFPRFSFQVPLSVTVVRSGVSAILEGISRTIGEGGLGGRINGKLIPGEYVRIRIVDRQLGKALEPRAQVRYGRNDDYGFAFLDVSPLEQAAVRRLCNRAASA